MESMGCTELGSQDRGFDLEAKQGMWHRGILAELQNQFAPHVGMDYRS
jgi:hypothetical protein